MAVDFISMTCPNCGAVLSVEKDKKDVICPYCDSKIIVHNDNEYFHHFVDDAKIKKMEADQAIEMKKLELLEKKREAVENLKKKKIKFSSIIIPVGALAIAVGFIFPPLIGLVFVGMLLVLIPITLFPSESSNDDDMTLGDMVRVPEEISRYESKNYAVIEALFLSAGFKNVKCIPLNDMRTNLLHNTGNIEAITINGHSITSGGGKYPADSAVIITYHSLR